MSFSVSKRETVQRKVSDSTVVVTLTLILLSMHMTVRIGNGIQRDTYRTVHRDTYQNVSSNLRAVDVVFCR